MPYSILSFSNFLTLATAQFLLFLVGIPCLSVNSVWTPIQWKYGAGAGLLKRMGGGGEGWDFSYLIFSRFIIFAFRNNLPFVKLCHAFEEKILPP